MHWCVKTAQFQSENNDQACVEISRFY